MNNVDFDPDQAAKAAARAYGVPTWVTVSENYAQEQDILDLEHDINFPVASSYQSEDAGSAFDIPPVHCCDQCDFVDKYEAQREAFEPSVYCDACGNFVNFEGYCGCGKFSDFLTERPSKNGGCS